MKKHLITSLIVLLTATAFAQNIENDQLKIKTLRLEARTDFDCYSQDGNIWTGFTGRFLNVVIEGDISKRLFYVYRQRLNTPQNIANFFDATDKLFLGWRITDNITLTAGKMVTAMGGIEFDLAPIDIYYRSRSWGLNCYQFGTGLSYSTKNGKNTFTLQCTNSPYGGYLYSGLYNYSALWRAKFKHFGPVCSVNLYEFQNGTFINVIALGTTYKFGHIDGYIDFMRRGADGHNEYAGTNLTFIGQIGVYLLNEKLHLFIKTGFDTFDDRPDANPETYKYSYIGGLEFFPLKNRNTLRIHTFFAVIDTKGEKNLCQCNIGITWRPSFINFSN